MLQTAKPHTAVELAARYQLIKQIVLAINYSFSQHQYEFDRPSSGVVKGNNIDTAPTQLGNARLTWRPNSAFNLEWEWLHLGSYYLNPASTHSYLGHELLQLRGQF